jgi:hypothetical protein
MARKRSTMFSPTLLVKGASLILTCGINLLTLNGYYDS